MNPHSNPLTLRLTLTSDWGVETGTGIAGGVDAVVEREAGSGGRPIIRGTVITGILREQALNAAHALDGAQPHGHWRQLALALFGTGDQHRPTSLDQPTDEAQPDRHPTPTRPPRDAGPHAVDQSRLIALSDAPITVTKVEDENGQALAPTHSVIGVSIDEETGAAKEDFLRLFERAGCGHGDSTVTLLDESVDPTTPVWTEQGRQDARLLLAIAAQLVTAVGSDRTSGDGQCRAVLIDGDQELDRQWCRQQLEALSAHPTTPSIPSRSRPAPATLTRRSTTAPEMATRATLTIDLDAPLVSYEVPYSNEVRSLDFLRGTVLLPWIHAQLRRAHPGDQAVRDAVVNGHLRVSDATPVVGGVRGLPVPLVLSQPKVKTKGDMGERLIEVWNRLISAEPEVVHTPLRSKYIFPSCDDTPAGFGAPALVGRQSTAISTATGAASSGQLFMVRALPAGVRLQAEVSLSQELADTVADRLPEILSGPARLGSRRLSGTYGQTTCQLGDLEALGAAEAGATAPSNDGAQDDDRAGAVTVWCTSDLLLRSPGLGPAGGIGTLLEALGGGIEVRLVPDHAGGDTGVQYAAGLRYRRVDGWSAAGQQPRASRIAIQAGSTLRIRPEDSGQAQELRKHLAALARDGLGQLREQGYGRIVVDHPLLEKDTFTVRSLKHHHFIGEGQER
ncbi:type III-B CRISPR module-associated protein Cmr3 [Actinomyces capricornis]|uniref:CRISPR-associated protein Cmr3 n=1 Tax=Actinomyces capricornis TaxID=2755559 RepID=A0ABM7UPZ0_9ACTO|nr:type III-B CRISPR module-associated protein Cmr3 [Actinomyces capricornis]BDA65550.1 hypothetical protein MANAM107_23840 [Actinomyces capricornis]